MTSKFQEWSKRKNESVLVMMGMYESVLVKMGKSTQRLPELHKHSIH